MTEYIERMRREFCAQSVNKVPEIYQHYFQNDEEDKESKKTSKTKKKSKRKSGNNAGLKRLGTLTQQRRGNQHALRRIVLKR